MEDVIDISRFQFAFTIMFHYLFPQLTMGLGLLIVILKGLALWKKEERYNISARFWAKIFAVNFTVGVVTGIPMEFQFGTNWAKFSTFAGGVIGQTLAMEGMFAFILESSFLGLFLFGEKKLGQVGHFFAAFMVFLGSWISGYFIIATNAWMQHPVAYEITTNATVQLTSFWGLLLNPWIGWQYAHNMLGSVVTAAFVMSSVGAFYILSNRDVEYGRMFIKLGVIAGFISSVLVALPTGDGQGKNVAQFQPVTLAAMQGLFETKEGAELVIVGQPDMDKLKIDNPIHIPRLLSFLTYYRWKAEVKGLDAFPRENWPTSIPLLYYSYHIMVGLGTIFMAIMSLAVFLLWKRKLFSSHWFLWTLMLSFPFPYIANTTGWMTAELGRQPWLVYGLLRTAEGISPTVSAGNSLFTLLGFMGMYALLGLLFLFLVLREVFHGPGSKTVHG